VTPAQEALHAAVQASFGDGDALISCIIVADVSAADGRRYLAHRSTTIEPAGMMAWTALGMLEAAARTASDHVSSCTEVREGDDE
jgi:hypothetical protein